MRHRPRRRGVDRTELLEVAALLKAPRVVLLDAGPVGCNASDWLLAALVTLHRDAGWTVAELRLLERVAAELAG